MFIQSTARARARALERASGSVSPLAPLLRVRVSPGVYAGAPFRFQNTFHVRLFFCSSFV